MIAEGLFCGTRRDEEPHFAFAALMMMLVTPKTSGPNMSPSAAAPSAVDAPLLHSAEGTSFLHYFIEELTTINNTLKTQLLEPDTRGKADQTFEFLPTATVHLNNM